MQSCGDPLIGGVGHKGQGNIARKLIKLRNLISYKFIKKMGQLTERADAHKEDIPKVGVGKPDWRV